MSFLDFPYHPHWDGERVGEDTGPASAHQKGLHLEYSARCPGDGRRGEAVGFKRRAHGCIALPTACTSKWWDTLGTPTATFTSNTDLECAYIHAVLGCCIMVSGDPLSAVSPASLVHSVDGLHNESYNIGYSITQAAQRFRDAAVILYHECCQLRPGI